MVKREFAPVTSTLLLEEVAEKPMRLALSVATVPPLAMTRLLPLPSRPTASKLLLNKSESAPVTSTLLLEEVAV